MNKKDDLLMQNIEILSKLKNKTYNDFDILIIIRLLKIFSHTLKNISNEELNNIIEKIDDISQDLSQAKEIIEKIIEKANNETNI